MLDIGCGSGTTVLELAARVGPDGYVLGADIADHSVARARERIATAGLQHAEAMVADVSVQPFGPNRFDLAFSRFGVMFFSDPAATFAKVRRAMKPSGRVALAVFRAAADNLWPHSPLAAARHLLPPIPLPGPEDPGPFSWAEPGRVHRILEGAGFREVSLTQRPSLLGRFFRRELGVPMHGEKLSTHQACALTTQLAAGNTTPCGVACP